MTTSLFALKDKTALITGGNGGLGKAIAMGLQGAGAEVIITGRDSKKNSKMISILNKSEAVVSLDVRNEEAVEKTMAHVLKHFGRLDILVNNAGLFRGGLIDNLSHDDWDAVIGTHLTGSFLCAKYASQMMIRGKRGGKIINIGSAYSLFGRGGFSDYAAAKTGILGLTRALAVELASNNIQVNTIIPGFIETDLTGGLAGNSRGEEIRRKTPAGRWGNPEDLVGAALFLASAASDFVTGTCITVDGGYSIADLYVYE